MRKLLFATAALSFAAIAPASAQMMGDPMMPMGAQSCVMNGQFVPCPPMGGMQPGMMQQGMMRPGMMNQGAGMSGSMMEEPGMDRPMTARERREQRRMMRQQSM